MSEKISLDSSEKQHVNYIRMRCFFASKFSYNQPNL